MSFGIEFNKSYTSSYMILPLNKNNGSMSVQCSDKTSEIKINAKNLIKNLDELRQADTDKNNIISLNELSSCKNKTDFLEKLEIAMEKFNSNPNRDYTKNLFENWI